jgi:metalloendopeptidase OMA1, mitochondrial
MNPHLKQVVINERIHIKSLTKIVLLALLPALVIGCATVPHTGRRQFNMVSDNDINKAGLMAYNDLIAKEPAGKDPRLDEMVKRVTRRISKVVEQTDRPNFDWDMRVIEKDTPNAFCLPGGKMVLFSGMAPYLKNEAGLAAVIAHEIAHVVARHGAERLSQQTALKGTLNLGRGVLADESGKLTQKARLALAALGMGGAVGVILPYSRLHELEADKIGLIYMAKAGYDPTAALQLWERMSQIKKPPIPVWLSTHPSDEDRVAKIREFLPEAQRLYNQAPEKFGMGAPM